MTDDIKLF